MEDKFFGRKAMKPSMKKAIMKVAKVWQIRRQTGSAAMVAAAKNMKGPRDKENLSQEEEPKLSQRTF